MPAAPPSLKGRILRLLANREHSRAELERKLRRFEEEPGSLARLLDALQARGFIDEQRVLESVLYRRAAKLGASRMAQELHDKGLPAAAVSQALDSLRQTEVARAKAVWQKKFGQIAPDARERARQMRFLAGRGFGGETIRRVVSGADED